MDGPLPWKGKGKVRAAVLRDALVLQIDGTTTRAGQVQQSVRELARKDLPRLGADFATYAVTIWIEGLVPHRRLDVDNVAKACLDSLTGVLWRDDRQVVHLLVEKFAAGPDRVTLVARRQEPGAEAPDLLTYLDSARRGSP